MIPSSLQRFVIDQLKLEANCASLGNLPSPLDCDDTLGELMYFLLIIFKEQKLLDQTIGPNYWTKLLDQIIGPNYWT